jgi:predicted RNA-binding protein with RPS1 domain
VQQTLSRHRLNIRVLFSQSSAWLSSLRDRVRSSLNANKVPTDKHLNYLLDLEYRLVTLDEVKQYVMTSEGALKCIELSLKKAKKDDAEIAKIKENIPTWDAVKIALEVSTFEAMFREKLAEQKKFEAEREAEQRAKEEAADQPAA